MVWGVVHDNSTGCRATRFHPPQIFNVLQVCAVLQYYTIKRCYYKLHATLQISISSLVYSTHQNIGIDFVDISMIDKWPQPQDLFNIFLFIQVHYHPLWHRPFCRHLQHTTLILQEYCRISSHTTAGYQYCRTAVLASCCTPLVMGWELKSYIEPNCDLVRYQPQPLPADTRTLPDTGINTARIHLPGYRSLYLDTIATPGRICSN